MKWLIGLINTIDGQPGKHDDDAFFVFAFVWLVVAGYLAVRFLADERARELLWRWL